MRSLERSCEPVGQLTRAHRHSNEHGRGGRPVQECPEQLDRRRIRPVKVVEHKHERPRLREELEERTHRPMYAVALVLQRQDGGSRESRKGGKDLRELRQYVLVELLQATRIESAQVLVKRVDENRERKLPFELRTGSCKDEPALGIRTTGELPEQAALADPGLTYEFDRDEVAAIHLGEDLLERTELLGASHELIG